MKKTYFALLGIAVGLSITSCQKDTTAPVQAPAGRTVISATTESTRATLDNLTFAWAAGDAIAVFDDAATTPTSNAPFTLVSGNGLNTASFSGTFADATDTPRNIAAIYPASSARALDASGNMAVGFGDQVQDYSNTSYGVGQYLLMVGQSLGTTPTGASLTFKHLMSVIDFNITDVPAGEAVTGVTFQAKNPTDMPFVYSGTIAPLSSDPTTVASPYYSNKTRTVVNNCPAGAPITVRMAIVPMTLPGVDMQVVIATTGATHTIERPAMNFTFARGMRNTTNISLDPSAWNGTTAQPTDYTGSPGIVSIATAENLAWLADQVNNHGVTFSGGYTFKVTAPINLGFKPWTPIGQPITSGTGTNVVLKSNTTGFFAGTFDGNSQPIRNLYVNDAAAKWLSCGLFGDVDGATIKNVDIVGGIVATRAAVTETNPYAAAALCGYVNNSTIKNCTSSARVSMLTSSTNSSGVGSIAGFVTSPVGTLIVGCINYGVIGAVPGGKNQLGGIVGTNGSVINVGIMAIAGCINKGVVDGKLPGGDPGSATAQMQGGIIGRVIGPTPGTTSKSMVTACVMAGTLPNPGAVGQTGYIVGSAGGKITGAQVYNCWAISNPDLKTANATGTPATGTGNVTSVGCGIINDPAITGRTPYPVSTDQGWGANAPDGGTGNAAATPPVPVPPWNTTAFGPWSTPWYTLPGTWDATTVPQLAWEVNGR